MTKLQTHYDNLKVARNAPAEVIRAAYKTLSQKYHPDRNNADVESARIMAIINASYEVLSDSAKRQQHDAWITKQESMESVATPRHATPTTSPKIQIAPTVGNRIFGSLKQYWLWYGIGSILVFSWATEKPHTPPPGPKPYQANPV